MTKTSKLWMLALGAAALFFSACEDDEVTDQSVSEVVNQDESGIFSDTEILVPSTATSFDEAAFNVSARTETSPEVDEFAKLVAETLKDQDMRKFIKAEANKMFDGDYDILVRNVINAKVDEQTFSEKITKTKSSNARASSSFSSVTKNPALNISVPVLIDDWDDKTKQPLVAIALGAIEGETKHIKAYDSNGKVYLLDANTEPDVPVIVIGNNERMDMIGDVDRGQKSQSDINAKRSGRMQVINYIRCPNLSDIESWYFGGPEIRFNGVAYSVSGASTFQAFEVTKKPSRDQAKDDYTFTSQDLFQWYFSGSNPSHGPNYYIQSSEIDDSGVTVEFSVSVTAGVKDGPVSGTAAFKITYKAQDKRLLGRLINYQDPTIVILSDDLIQFRMTEKSI